MQEHLLYMGGGSVIGGTIPGEGNSVCSITDPEVCWYGEVPSETFITGSQLSKLVNYSFGTAFNDGEPWLMFSLDGAKLLTPKKPIRHSVSVNSLNDANLVNGDKIVNIGGNQFRVRLFKTTVNNNHISSPSDDPSICYGSEWNKLMYRVYGKIGVSKEGIPFGEFVKYTDAELGISPNERYPGTTTLTQEISSHGSSYRGYFSVTYLGQVYVNTNEVWKGWRPVLELVNV